MAYNSNKTINGLEVETTIADTDELVFGDVSDTNRAKKITFANLKTEIVGDDTAFVRKADYDANSILYATSDNTPVALTVATNSVVGRVAGAITTFAVDSDLTSVSTSDDTIPSAKATKTALDLKAPIASPTFTGVVTSPAIKLTTGAGVNKVLTSDADGDATWETLNTAASADVQTFTVDGTWTKPTGAKSVFVQMWGAGGSGGAGDGGGTGEGGGGGGGGSYKEWTFDASDLSATEAVVVGEGGAGGAGGGTAGENSSFGTTKVIAYGGGGGDDSVSDGGAGGGGGIASAGGTATSTTGGAGGNYDGGAGGSGAVGGNSSFGGGGGGAGANTGFAGGRSIHGGGGGGGGAVNTGAPGAGGSGGDSFYGGAGGAGGRSNVGTVAGGTSIYGGAGGGSSYGLAGTAGSIPGGGGGGGSDGGNGGAGGRGEVIVTTYF